MNYRHAYHAGNFGDVLKHVVLMLCIEYLKRKATPFRVIDTHAGAGLYRLDQGEAERTGEWRSGIARVFGLDAAQLPAETAQILQPYFDLLKSFNADERLVTYPGSPLLAQYALRSTDALVANELQAEDGAALEIALGRQRTCRVTHLDAYTALKASLPPKERRGLVLIDPPFEEPGELKRMGDALDEALARFATGIYLLWYPIKDEKPVARFCRKIAGVVEKHGLKPALRTELLLRPLRNPTILNGAGLVVVNAPYQLDQALSVLLPVLAERMGDAKKGWYKLGTIAAEGASRTNHHE